MKKIIIFGEAIWDIYEGGQKHLGGSGLNVAWHLQALGLSTEFISRVGNDRNALEMLDAIRDWGIDSKHIQMDPDQPTAYLDVIIDEDGEHHYPSPPKHALDFITFKQSWLDFPAGTLMYHGTYILRSEMTRNTIAAAKKRGFDVFLDMNLRENYWSHELLDQWVQDIKFLKLSDHEFSLWYPDVDLALDGQIEFLQQVMKEKNIEHVLYTLGQNGSVLIHGQDVIRQKPTQKLGIENTVGAGDAYCAGFIYARYYKRSLVEAVEFATKLAEQICTLKGATSIEQAFYDQIQV